MESTKNEVLKAILTGAVKKQSCGSGKKEKFCTTVQHLSGKPHKHHRRHDVHLYCNIESINLVLVDLKKEEIENLVMECKGNIKNLKR